MLATSVHRLEAAFRAHVERLEATNELWARARAKRGPAVERAMPPRPANEEELAARIAASLRAHPNYRGTR